jgi:rhodanese-related sulfurtransferase
MSATVEGLVTAARSRIRHLTPAEVEAELLARTSVLVDVRERAELDEHGWIAGAVHIPRGLLEFRADPASPMHVPELDPAQRTIVYDAAGRRSALAVETLARLGYSEVAHLEGGVTAWKRAGLPVVGLASWHQHLAPPTVGGAATGVDLPS